jgi:hypothetical protein
MIWNTIWNKLTKSRRKQTQDTDTKEPEAEEPEFQWLEAANNPWGVPVLDVRPITLGTLSTSSNPECASNAISFGQDDGIGFLGDEPPVNRIVKTCLRFRRDRLLAEGGLFIPSEMEHKWALYFHQRQILCIRSWLRKVNAIAEVEQADDYVEITSIRGSFSDEDEKPEFTVRVLDYLLRSHALGLVFPAPLPEGLEKEPRTAALWCMSNFGKFAWFATPEELKIEAPEQPLRSQSLLHISVARGDIEATDKYLDSGMPIDLLASDGLAPMHWALAQDNTTMLRHLIERGSAVDIRSADGATPLMNAVQNESVEQVNFLLDQGSDSNAVDARGFTALHRAAEMGKIELVKILLARGASPKREAQGYTPRSLAEKRGERAIVELLDG